MYVPFAGEAAGHRRDAAGVRQAEQDAAVLRRQQRHHLLGLDLREDDRLLRGRVDLVDQPFAAGADEQRAVLLDHREHEHGLAEDSVTKPSGSMR